MASDSVELGGVGIEVDSRGPQVSPAAANPESGHPNWAAIPQAAQDPDLRHWDYCLVFPAPEESPSFQFAEEEEKREKQEEAIEERRGNRVRILKQLARAGLILKLFYSVDKDEIFCKITATPMRLRQEAQRIDYEFQAWNYPEDEKERETLAFKLYDQTSPDLETIGKVLQGTPIKYEEIELELNANTALATVRPPVQSNAGSSPLADEEEAYVDPLPVGTYNLKNFLARYTYNLPGEGNHTRTDIFRNIDRIRLIYEIITNPDEVFQKGIAPANHNKVDRLDISARKAAADAGEPTPERITLACAGVDLNKELDNGNLVGHFALHHEEELEQLGLVKNWASFGAFFKEQPFESIRLYYGEKVAMYFAWLQVYIQALIAPMIFGMVVFVIQWSTKIDNIFVFFMAIFVALWSTFFLEAWKRREVSLATRWGTHDFEDEELERPQFVGEEEIDPVSGRKVKSVPGIQKALKITRSFMIIGAYIGVLGVTVFLTFALKVIAKRSDYYYAVPAVNAILIMVFNKAYGVLAETLTDRENHRTDTEYEDNLIAKTFIFQFINSYGAMFYSAFLKGTGPLLFGSPAWRDSCKTIDGIPNNCLAEVTNMLMIVLGVAIVVNNFMEYFMPRFKRWKTIRAEAKSEDAAGSEPIRKLSPEDQAKYIPYGGTMDEYAEMIIQYGFVTLFVVAFPAAPFLAFINNLLEVRIDATAMVGKYQRGVPEGAQDIGTWQYIMEIMSYLSVMTNTAILAFNTKSIQVQYKEYADPVTGRRLPYIVEQNSKLVPVEDANEWALYAQGTQQQVWIFFAFEHALLFIKIVSAAIIPDMPESTSDLQELYVKITNKYIQGGRAEEDIERPKAPAQVLNASKLDLFGHEEKKWSLIDTADPEEAKFYKSS